MAYRSQFEMGFIALGLAGLFGACGPPKCAEDVEQWIDEAPAALEEFLVVREEVLADTAFISQQHGQIRLFLMARDTIAYPKARLPKLLAWFRAGRSSIDLHPDHTAFYYRECRVGSYSAWGMAYFERMQYPWNVAVEKVDSADLGGGWHASVTTCRGCGDS